MRNDQLRGALGRYRKTFRSPSSTTLRTGFDKLRASGEDTGDFWNLPLVLSLSKHERLFFSSMLTLVLLLLGLSACQSDPNSPRGVAERFLDAHYVAIDLQAAKPYCTGLALKRLEDEIRLTAGYQIDESTRKPHVHYRLREEKPRGGKSVSFLYETTISVDGAGQFTKKILLTMRQGEQGWRVANYSEFD